MYTCLFQFLLSSFRRDNLLPRRRCGCQPPSLRSSTEQPACRLQLRLLADVEHRQTRHGVCIVLRRLRTVDLVRKIRQRRFAVHSAGHRFRIFRAGKRSSKLLLHLGRARRERLWHRRREVRISEEQSDVVVVRAFLQNSRRRRRVVRNFVHRTDVRHPPVRSHPARRSSNGARLSGDFSLNFPKVGIVNFKTEFSFQRSHRIHFLAHLSKIVLILFRTDALIA